MTDQPYRICIAGGGTAGWMAAALLARFAPHYAIELVESEEIGTVGVGEATIPQIHHFNAALGLDEGAFLAATRGSYKLGIAFDGWLRPGHSYMHAFGTVGAGHDLMPFHQLWLRAEAGGTARPLERYSANALAARALAVAPAGGGLPYAYHFDAALYAGMLRRFAEERGATRTEGRLNAVEKAQNGDIAALRTADGRLITADFFIDCTGFRALLIEGAMAGGWEDWSHWLPCDRAVAVPCASGGDFTPYTRSIARVAGWQWRIPLQHRIGNGYVYSSAHVGDDEAAALLLAHLDGPPAGEPRFLRFATGKRRRQWVGNCLALGLAAGFMEPLESTSIHLVQSALSRFMQMLPGARPDPAAIAAFNDAADFEWSRIRDFLVLHYHANGRAGEPLWDAARAMTLPDTLAQRLDLWRATGHIAREHDELFTEQGWFQVLAGQGVTGGYNPLADALSDTELAADLARCEARAHAAVRGLPGHAAVLGTTIRRTMKETAA